MHHASRDSTASVDDLRFNAPWRGSRVECCSACCSVFCTYSAIIFLKTKNPGRCPGLFAFLALQARLIPAPSRQEKEKREETMLGVAPLPSATGAFRAAIGMAAAPQRGANPSFFPRFALKAAKPSARRRLGRGRPLYSSTSSVFRFTSVVCPIVSCFCSTRRVFSQPLGRNS